MKSKAFNEFLDLFEAGHYRKMMKRLFFSFEEFVCFYSTNFWHYELSLCFKCNFIHDLCIPIVAIDNLKY